MVRETLISINIPHLIAFTKCDKFSWWQSKYKEICEMSLMVYFYRHWRARQFLFFIQVFTTSDTVSQSEKNSVRIKFDFARSRVYSKFCHYYFLQYHNQKK